MVLFGSAKHSRQKKQQQYRYSSLPGTRQYILRSLRTYYVNIHKIHTPECD